MCGFFFCIGAVAIHLLIDEYTVVVGVPPNDVPEFMSQNKQ